MASPAKRCLYEVLGLPRECTTEEIRSAIVSLHFNATPTSLSGLESPNPKPLLRSRSSSTPTKSSPTIGSVHGTVLTAPRSFSPIQSSSRSSSSSGVPDFSSFFSNSVYSGYTYKGKGFYKVYTDVFDRIYRNELNFAKKLGLGDVVQEAPLMGNLDSPYAQASAFYGYWLGFSTVMDFVWEDQFDAMAGPNRKSRRWKMSRLRRRRKMGKRLLSVASRWVVRSKGDGLMVVTPNASIAAHCFGHHCRWIFLSGLRPGRRRRRLLRFFQSCWFVFMMV